MHIDREITRLKDQVDTLKVLADKQEIRIAGLIAVIRSLIRPDEGGVHVDVVEKAIENADNLFGREPGYRRGDMNQLLRDVGLMNRAE